jgi:transcriptional regulator GlxA family with amidase domain
VVAERIEPMATDGPLKVIADRTFGDVPDPEVVIVPGGGAPTIKAMGNQVVGDYLRQAADTVPVVGSVCTGALVLAAAGLLEGRQATPHWAYHRLLERLGATYLPQRWVEDGKFITSAGVSAGIDMALALVARLTDEATARMVHRLGPGGPGHLRADARPHGPTAAGRPARAPGQAQRLSRPAVSRMGSGGGAGHVRLVGLLEGLEALAVLLGVEFAAGQPLG